MNMGKIMLLWESLKGSLKNLPRTNPAPFNGCRWCFVRFALNDKKRHTAMYPFSDPIPCQQFLLTVYPCSDPVLLTILAHCVPLFWSYTLLTILAHCLPLFWSCHAHNSCPLCTTVYHCSDPFLTTIHAHRVPLFWSCLANNSCQQYTPTLVWSCLANPW